MAGSAAPAVAQVAREGVRVRRAATAAMEDTMGWAVRSAAQGAVAATKGATGVRAARAVRAGSWVARAVRVDWAVAGRGTCRARSSPPKRGSCGRWGRARAW